MPPKEMLDEYLGLVRYCSRCNEYWPADNEFFHANRCKPDGLSEYCKACFLEARHRWMVKKLGRPIRHQKLIKKTMLELIEG